MRLYWLALIVLAADVALHLLAFLVVFVQASRPGPGEPTGSAS
jgi:hypothetical protein